MRIVWLLCWLWASGAFAAAPVLTQVVPGQRLNFPADFGAHPDYRTEWWYATGWLTTPDNKPLGFQVTFFRVTTASDSANTSHFAPRQLIIAHAALSDPALGHLQHDQKSARAGFGLAYANVGNTDVKLDRWTLKRGADGVYQTRIRGREFSFDLRLTPSQPPMLQGDHGYSRKGPEPGQASYYYSEPQLRVSGTVTRNGKPVTVSGSAWLDHEWSTRYMDARAVGWDWVGANLADGGALMAFQMRRADGSPLWAHASLRDAHGKTTEFDGAAVQFKPRRYWRSPRTGARYPVAMELRTGSLVWRLMPLQDDQELDSRLSTGAVYWEGATTLTRDGQPAGRGYLELTGYAGAMKL
jgi:predicted secreted hydrolase